MQVIPIVSDGAVNHMGVQTEGGCHDVSTLSTSTRRAVLGGTIVSRRLLRHGPHSSCCPRVDMP